jgi:hypothetical protein
VDDWNNLKLREDFGQAEAQRQAERNRKQTNFGITKPGVKAYSRPSRTFGTVNTVEFQFRGHHVQVNGTPNSDLMQVFIDDFYGTTTIDNLDEYIEEHS